MKNPSSLKTKPKKYKTNHFTLLQERTSRWKVSGKDSEGNYRRIRFYATDLSEAISRGETILKEASSQSRNIPCSKEHPMLQISDALLQSASTRNWDDHTRNADQYYSLYFLKWIDKIGLKYWDELRFEHLQKYNNFLQGKNLSYNTIRLYLTPVRRTAAWMAANWPEFYINFSQTFRLSSNYSNSSLYDEETGNPFLSIHKILDFLDWISRNSHNESLLTGISLQGLAGLQLEEALRLRWEKVIWKENSIIIDGKVKNRYRIRKIPLPSVVVWILKQTYHNQNPLESQKIIHDYKNHDSYSRAFKRELKLWDSGICLSAKDLRNTLQTTAIDRGWYGFYVQRYVGHAPTTIGERHYHGDQGNRIVPHFREKVVSKIEDEIKSWKAPAGSLILPGLRLVVNQ